MSTVGRWIRIDRQPPSMFLAARAVDPIPDPPSGHLPAQGVPAGAVPHLSWPRGSISCPHRQHCPAFLLMPNSIQNPKGPTVTNVRNRIRLRAAALLIALTITTMLTAVQTATAHASEPRPAPAVTTAGGGGMSAQSSTPCASGRLCTYWNTFWQDPMYYYTAPVPPQSLCTHIGGGVPNWINQISSARNFTSHTVKFHDDGNCGNGNGYTTTYVLNSGSSMDWGGTIWNDEWSSIQWF